MTGHPTVSSTMMHKRFIMYTQTGTLACTSDTAVHRAQLQGRTMNTLRTGDERFAVQCCHAVYKQVIMDL